MHLVIARGNQGTAKAVTGTGIAPHETQAIAIHPLAGMGADIGPFRVGQAFVHRQTGRLTFGGHGHRLFRRQRPGLVEIQLRYITGQECRIGKTSGFIGRGVTGNITGGLYRGTNGLRFEIGGAGRSLAMAKVDRYPQALVPVVFNGFHLALTHRHGIAVLATDHRFGGRGTLSAGLFEDVGHDIL